MRAILRFTFLGLLSIQPLLANGGGYFRGGIERSGDVSGFEPEETDKIRMLDEKLTIAFGREEASVEIRYLMRNESDKKVQVRFGFPVEESLGDDLNEDGSATGLGPSGKGIDYTKSYHFSVGGKITAAKWQPEPKPAADVRFKSIAGWLVSEITFQPGEEKPLLITFISLYPKEEVSVSEDSFTSASIFKYRLSSAACWAGTIGTGRIVLKPSGSNPSELKVIKPVNRFKKEGDEWIWNFSDLEPTLADDLEIEVSPEVHSYGNEYTQRGEQWSMAHSNYKITASSTLPKNGEFSYDASNVKERYGDKAWSEGAPGPGIGEWLELKPETPKSLAAIEIRPGYSKYAEQTPGGLFLDNGRPKKIRVDLNGEYSFNVDVPDRSEFFKFQIPAYGKPVHTARLTFTDVWKGRKYEDLCVGSVILHAKLDKKPKIQPAR